VRGLYQLGDNDTGQDQTVAFVGANASPTLVGDVRQYSGLHNLPDPNITQLVAPGVYRHPDTPKQVPGDYYGEESLDAEAIHTTAPAAHLLYVASSNANQDFDASINHIVDKHLAPIISISYGFTGEGVPRGFINSLNGTFQQAVATGIGVFVSSGDGGDEVGALGTPSVDFYADSPYVTAVGGTSAAVLPGSGGSVFPSGSLPTPLTARAPDSAAALYGLDDPTSALNKAGWKRDFEVGWQTGLDKINSPLLAPTDLLATTFSLSGTLASDLPGTFNGGGGGGVSRLFPQPSYQKGVTDRISTSGRAVPDISALADPNTGFLVGQTQAFPNGCLCVCQAAGQGVVESRLAGPGCDLSEELAVGVEPAALDCRVAPGCPPGFAATRRSSVIMVRQMWSARRRFRHRRASRAVFPWAIFAL